MKIIADENMPALDETFAAGNELIRLNGRHISAEDLVGADALLVRSITRVDEDLLKNSNIRFVGSATIGIDHLDTQWLTANRIAWANAPGCNADAAAQFTLAMMMLACKRLDKDLLQQSVGVVGCGNVGSRLVKLLQTLGIKVVTCDPPLQDAGQAGLVSMREACQQNIVSVHVPLVKDGPYPTQYLFDQSQLASLKTGTLLVNAARGGIVEANALLAELLSGRLHAALDVWPNEPFIEHQLLRATTVATPHVAGSSVQGKRNGTLMIYRAFCEAFPQQTSRTGLSNLCNSGTIAGTLELPSGVSLSSTLQQLLEICCPIARDDHTLRSLIEKSDYSKSQSIDHHLTLQPRVQIDGLRSTYPKRHEFASWTLDGSKESIDERLLKLGFSSASAAI